MSLAQQSFLSFPQGQAFLLHSSKQKWVFSHPGQQGLLPFPQWPQAFVPWETKVSSRIQPFPGSLSQISHLSSNLSLEHPMESHGEEPTSEGQHPCVCSSEGSI